jgi:hypothetical protein
VFRESVSYPAIEKAPKEEKDARLTYISFDRKEAQNGTVDKGKKTTRQSAKTVIKLEVFGRGSHPGILLQLLRLKNPFSGVADPSSAEEVHFLEKNPTLVLFRTASPGLMTRLALEPSYSSTSRAGSALRKSVDVNT